MDHHNKKLKAWGINHANVSSKFKEPPERGFEKWVFADFSLSKFRKKNNYT